VGSVGGIAVVDIAAGPLATITVTPNPVTVTVGETQTFTATGADAYGNLVSISPMWATNAGTMAGNILTVQTTPASDKHVTATVGSMSGSANVDIVTGPLASILVTPNPVTVTVGAAQPFTVIGADAYGNPVPISPTWTTDAGAMINNVLTAQTTPVSGGHVTATVGSVHRVAIVNIVAGPLNHLVITPKAVTLAPGEQQQFSVVGFDAYSNTIASLVLSWQVTQPDAGSIDTTGLFTAGIKAGEYSDAVVVSSGIISDMADVTVRSSYLVYLPIILRQAPTVNAHKVRYSIGR